ncbi:MAG: antibiotic biosynthesis monooxygenase [Vicinamibacterales bacterium]
MAEPLIASLAATPAKVVIERRVLPGADAAFKAWADRFVSSAGRAAGHQGTSVLSAANNVRFILLRFASHADLAAWQGSFEYGYLMREANSVSQAGDAAQVRSGLETWFTLPELPMPAAPPPKWKMALLTWLSLLPMVVALGYLFAPFGLPFVAQVALTTAIPVSMLTWVIMPRLTRALYFWLYKER